MAKSQDKKSKPKSATKPQLKSTVRPSDQATPLLPPRQRSPNRRPLERRNPLPPFPQIHRPSQPKRPRFRSPIRRKKFPRMLPQLRRTPPLGPLLAHHARHQRPAVLEVVCRRQAQRLLQLRGPPPGPTQKQGCPDLRPRTRKRIRHGHHLPGALPPRKRSRRRPPRFRRTKNRRPRHHPHAHDPGASDHHAGLRPPGRGPLGGLRRLQRRSLRPARRRLRQPRPHLR